MRRKRLRWSPSAVRPLWRPVLVFAGAVLLLLAGVGFCIVSQRRVHSLQSGIALATPDRHVLGCEAYDRGVRLFYDRGFPFGIPTERRHASVPGCGGVAINTRLQGTDAYVYARWWLVIGFLSVLVTVAGRDVRAGVARRRRIAARLCARCGYDLRATPDRCPECGAEHSHGRPAAP